MPLMFMVKIKSMAWAMLTATKNALINSSDLMDSIGKAVSREFKQNFRELNYKRSRYGHNFYTHEGEDKTVYEVGSNIVVVRVESYKMVHKLKGGTVRAKNARMLAIPVSELAKQRGVSPSKWKDAPELFLMKSKRGNLLLMSGKSKMDLQTHFVLRHSVTHKPHPEVIPEKSRLIAAAEHGIEDAKFLSKIRY